MPAELLDPVARGGLEDRAYALAANYEYDDDHPFYGERRPVVMALMVALLRQYGWVDRDALPVLSMMFDHIEPAELAAAKEAARSVRDPYSDLIYDHVNHTLLDQLVAVLSVESPSSALGMAEPAPLDMATEPEPPDWIVPGMVERGAVTLLAAASGVGKSLVVGQFVVAAATGGQFLGYHVPESRVLVVDGENPEALTQARWRAMGLTASSAPNALYVGKAAGVRLGEPGWSAWLEEQVRRQQVDVVVLDTISAVSTVKANDNDEISAFHAAVLAPLTARGVAAVLVHHERKGGRQRRGNRAEETLGGTQWSGKSDHHITLAERGAYEEAPRDDGTVATLHRLELRRSKVRSGWEDVPLALEVRGRKSERGGADLELSVQLAGNAETSEEIHDLVAAAADEIGRGQLAAALGMRPDDSRFRRLLDSALAAGLLVKLDRRGRYRATQPAEAA